jgi:hypothetical protein
MIPEILFMKYSVPCAQVLVTIGKITEKKFQELKEKTRKEEPMEKEELEKIFEAAFRRIKDLAKRMGKDPWDEDVIIKYFRGQEHNQYIDDGEGAYGKVDDRFKERCKVRVGKIRNIKKIESNTILEVEIDNEIRIVFGDLIKEPKVGEAVTVHQFYACEKI